jgi:Tetratricopeptide repeat
LLNFANYYHFCGINKINLKVSRLRKPPYRHKIFFLKNFKLHIVILICLLCSIVNTSAVAQNKTGKQIADSMRAAMKQEKQTRDSITVINKAKQKLDIEARRYTLDSMKAQRIAFRDSVTNAREIIRKEREKITKQKNSKKYIKEQEKIKQNRIDSIAYVRAVKADAIKQERKEKAEQAAEQRKTKIEELVKTRKQTSDSIANARKELQTALKEIRKKRTDSIAKVRKVIKDSITVVKKNRLEQLAKLFKTPEQKQAEQAMKEHEKKKSNFSNQNFLKKPWSLPRNIYQNTVTRYNYYYNAKKLYNESITELAKNSTEDYTKLLSLEKILNTNAKISGGNMDSVIRKCATSIQIHDPRSRWFDDLHFLMGKAYLLKGETENAIAMFQYIGNEYKEKPKKQKNLSKKQKAIADSLNKYSIASPENRRGIHKLYHQPVRNDALLYLAKSYLQAGSYLDAQTLLGILELDAKYPKRLQAELALVSAQLYLATNSNTQAIEALQNAVKKKGINKDTKLKTMYLLGQLLAMQNQFVESNKQFEKIITLHPNVDMDFYSKLNIAKNTAKLPDANIDKIESMFGVIIKDGKYTKYLDKAYLGLGLLQLETNIQKAEKNLEKAIENAKGNTETKSEAYLALGNSYYKSEVYRPSKLSYDSALQYMTNPSDTTQINVTIRRDLLNDLVTELDVIAYNDSLIRLATLSKKEQLAIVKKAYKADKKANKKIEEQIENGEESPIIEPKNEATSTFYFANAETVKKGAAIFAAKWGSRPNVDNWRRLAAISTFAIQKENSDNIIEQEQTEALEEKIEKSELDKYLSAIPTTEESMRNCNTSRENAIYNAAVIFYAGIGNDAKTIEYIQKLLKDYPNTDYTAKAYYTLFLAYKRKPDAANAAKYLALLNTEFSTDPLAVLANNPNAVVQNNKKEQQEVLAYYNETYTIFKDNKFAEIAQRAAYARSKFEKHALLAKFDLLEAMSTAGQKKYATAKQQLTALIEKYTGNEEATFAQDVLALLNQKDTSGNDNPVGKNTVPSFANNKITAYTYEPNQPHYFMFILKEIDDRISPVKSAFGDFNNLKHSTEDIENSLYLIDQNSGVLFFKQFVNEKMAKAYMKEVSDNKKIYSVLKNEEFEFSIISENNYMYFKNTRDLQGYLNFYKKNYK